MMRFRTSLVFLVLIFCVSCRKENRLDCFTSNGEDVSESRVPGIFDSIEVFDKIDLEVKSGTTHSVVVKCGEHIIHNIKTEVKEGKLTVGNGNTCDIVRGYKRRVRVEVFVPYLKCLKHYGVGPARIGAGRVQDTVVVRAESSGDIFIDGSYSEVRVASHGNGDIYLKGRTKRLDVYTYGTNYLNAEELIIKENAYIQSTSIGDCTINADSLHHLECTIQGDGNVYYTGNPPEVIDLSDKKRYSGRLYKKD